ncbi:substrate-binding domain-containing protein [Kibdelosporangium phytohabitans]|uniref:Transcriptional regulator LacI/GalR-like sensor domain-containing protein n=1 Tax=Kibdelosporangium phytohabitans TaxID=860235 RepID=A0A0N7F2M2_9PSEU|nr:substrate-binding domain-containing protein [Kibdelosporangium phytohabitans]ALG06223.1 hypothetical protein AOZ06_04125 [Kibdelosporangium phytohabitans]MBE1465678.1 LacI family transcriptional regulator [Kibdelosporangium phytohabitans]
MAASTVFPPPGSPRSTSRSDLHGPDAAATATSALFDLDEPPTALFTGQNLVTVGAMRALRDRGLHHQVALIGFDDFPLADMLEPGVTVLRQDVPALGRKAAELIFTRITDEQPHPRTPSSRPPSSSAVREKSPRHRTRTRKSPAAGPVAIRVGLTTGETLSSVRCTSGRKRGFYSRPAVRRPSKAISNAFRAGFVCREALVHREAA